ncbi:tetratricopeptide repeat protein [Viridibacterium curvum]|uniref:protein O-GlcNAc transferase n=1 Tax=Viridibacterium curvum TaxID=1101404 RepID=A0ABP9R0T7_9RHOO
MLEQVNLALSERAAAQIAANDWRGACDTWQLLVQNKPLDPNAWVNLGIARAHTGQYPEAIDAYATAMQHGLPEDEGACGIGLVFCLRQQYDIAAENLEMALARNPRNHTALSNLVVCYTRLGRIAHAFEAAQALLELDPENLSALGSLGTLCKDAGMAEEAVAWNLRAAQAAPDSPEQVSNLLWSMLHSDARSTEDLLEIGKEFNRRALARCGSAAATVGFNSEDLRSPSHAPLQSPPQLDPRESGTTLPSRACGRGAGGEGESSRTHLKHLSAQTAPSHLSPNPSPPRGEVPHPATQPIKLGLLSADLRHHAVGRFLTPLLEAFDPAHVQVIAYNTGHFRDDLSARAQAVCDWRDVGALSDDALIALIRKDRLDVLIDLSGHTDGSRLAALAQRAAPVQISWLGYPASTGLDSMDYVLVPPDPQLQTGNWCNEKPLALPDCYYVRETSQLHFSDAPAPVTRNGHITFGCLNNLAKYSPSCIAAWSRILKRMPTARLVLVVTSGAERVLQQDLLNRFAEHGVAPERLDLRGRMDYDAYRRTWHEFDLALDAFPFNGGTTGFDALCAGIPFVTLSGEGLHARLGENLLRPLGLASLAATNIDDYVEKAVTLASDPAALEAVRQTLRNTLPHSALCDLPRFARGLEQLLKTLRT